MRMRKLFAGIAAAATMLGGLALGASTASAAVETPLLQVNNAQTGHTYTPYKFADLKLNADGQSVDVSTDSDWSGVVAKAADAADGEAEKPSWFTVNPAAYVATFSPEELRVFAQKLTELASNDYADLLASPDGTALTVDSEDADKSLPINVSGEGWYFVTDLLAGEYGTPAVVTTTVSGQEGTFPVVNGDQATGQGNITVTGQFNAKNDNPDIPSKHADDSTVTVGQAVTYTITHKIPTGTDEYVMTDTASKGLTVDSSIQVVVKGARDDGGDLLLVNDSDYMVHQNVSEDTKETVTVIELDPTQVAAWASKTVEVQYQATVNSDILDNENGEATNKVSVNGGEEIKTTVKTYDFKIKKQDSKGNNLGGAEFAIKDDMGRWLKYDSTNGWKTDESQNAPTYRKTTDGNGVINFKGLGNGTYTVVETKAPNGFDHNFLPTFAVTIDEDGNVSLSDGDAFGLVSEVKDHNTVTAIRVKNVKSVAELPLTGAAGTAMFSVIAVLLAGAAATVYAKSRNTKRMLNA